MQLDPQVPTFNVWLGQLVQARMDLLQLGLQSDPEIVLGSVSHRGGLTVLAWNLLGRFTGLLSIRLLGIADVIELPELAIKESGLLGQLSLRRGQPPREVVDLIDFRTKCVVKIHIRGIGVLARDAFAVLQKRRQTDGHLGGISAEAAVRPISTGFFPKSQAHAFPHPERPPSCSAHAAPGLSGRA